MAKKTSKSKSDTKVEAPVVEAPVVQAPVVEEQVNEESSIEQTFKSLYEKIANVKAELSKLTSELKDAHKQVNKAVKESEKRQKKKADRPKREPSGFAKPTQISTELCEFLQKPLGTEMARTEVTKYLTSYIKEHSLQFAEDKRKIKPDKKLAKLLNLKKDDQVTYFNLQKYMKPHFETAKSAPAH